MGELSHANNTTRMRIRELRGSGRTRSARQRRRGARGARSRQGHMAARGQGSARGCRPTALRGRVQFRGERAGEEEGNERPSRRWIGLMDAKSKITTPRSPARAKSFIPPHEHTACGRW